MSAEEIDPPKLVTGRDLLAMGLWPGKEVGKILERVRVAQLEGTVQTRAEAVDMARRLAHLSMETRVLPPTPERPPNSP
jgi:poly(A) polymerase